MTNTGTLCQTCEAIDFKYYLKHPIQSGWKPIRSGIQLGFLDEVVARRDCAFCRLVTQYLIQQWRTPTLDTVIDGERVECMLDNAETWQSYDKQCGYDYDFVDSQTQEAQYFSGRDTHRFVVRAFPSPAGTEGLEEAMYIHLLVGPGLGTYQQYCGRRVQQLDADLDLARTWLSTCESMHKDGCACPPWLNMDRPESMWVIDVRRRRVVSAPASCRYLALSYVWGGPQAATLTSKDLIPRADRNVYMDLPLKIPQTIEDAMQVVAAFQETYLWVDALCIPQDDSEEKQKQLASMSGIYGSAVLVIMAAASDHADAGLAGISHYIRSTEQTVESVKGLSLSLTLPPLVAIELGNTWNSRGWVYQERMLSKRSLLFTKEQMYFLCSCAVWCEEVISEPSAETEKFVSRDLGQGRPPQRPYSFDTSVYNLHDSTRTDDDIHILYIRVIQEFSMRKLTYSTDRIDAISGVLYLMERANFGRFYWGTPETLFDIALLWLLRDGGERTPEDTRFPSWSWAGWNTRTGVMWDLSTLMSRSCVLPAVSFYLINETMDPLPIPSFQPTRRDKGTSALYLNPCGVAPRHISSAPELPSSLDQTKRRSKYYIYFWTSSALFRIGKELTLKSFMTPSVMSPFEILDTAGRRCGSILLPRENNAGCNTQPLEFIFLSYTSELDEYAEEKLGREGYKPPQVTGPGTTTGWYAVNAMLISWEGPVAERIALGRIHIDAWKAAGCEGKWVLLG